MKRLLALLLALCLPLPALAETIAERIGAPETWQGEFTTSTGKSPIRLNMTVEVPEVDCIPIWRVEPHPFSIEDATHMADQLLGEDNWQQLVPDPQIRGADIPVEDGPRWIEWRDDDLPGWSKYACKLYQGEYGRSARVEVSGHFLDSMPGWYASNDAYYSSFGEHDRDIGALEDAIAVADEVISRIAPDMVYDSAMPLDDLHVRDNPHYHLYYTRKVGDILVTNWCEQGAREAVKTFNPVLRLERLEVEVDGAGVYSIAWNDPIDVMEMLREDCELLPFDQIMDIFGAIAPLTLLSLEGESNVSLTINKAVLGYMCLQERDKPTSYQLVPVWDFRGVRTLGREVQGRPLDSWLTINAIDGTIIDRFLGY